jgi:hypothetical protein
VSYGLGGLGSAHLGVQQTALSRRLVPGRQRRDPEPPPRRRAGEPQHARPRDQALPLCPAEPERRGAAAVAEPLQVRLLVAAQQDEAEPALEALGQQAAVVQPLDPADRLALGRGKRGGGGGAISFYSPFGGNGAYWTYWKRERGTQRGRRVKARSPTIPSHSPHAVASFPPGLCLLPFPLPRRHSFLIPIMPCPPTFGLRCTSTNSLQATKLRRPRRMPCTL